MGEIIQLFKRSEEPVVDRELEREHTRMMLTAPDFLQGRSSGATYSPDIAEQAEEIADRDSQLVWGNPFGRPDDTVMTTAAVAIFYSEVSRGGSRELTGDKLA